MDKTLLLDVVNYMLKSVLMILKRNTLTVKSLNLIPSLPSRKLSLKPQTRLLWLSPQISTTESMLKLLPSMMNYLMPLKRVRLVLRMILNQELIYWLLNLVGIRMRLLRSGVLDLITLEEIS